MNRTANEERNRRNSAQIAAEERSMKREEGAKDRAQREAASRRAAAAQIAAAGIKAAGSVAGKANPVGKAIFMNDASWYTKLGLEKYNAQIPAQRNWGTTFNDETSTTSIGVAKSYPAIAVFNFVPSIGSQDGAGSVFGYRTPVNYSTQMFLNELRKLNSRVGIYEPPEIGLFTIAGAELVYWLNRCILWCQIANTFIPTDLTLNLCILDAIIRQDTASKLTARVFLKNIKEFRAQLALIISDFNANIPLPKQLSLVARKEFIARGMWKDADLVHSTKFAFSTHWAGKFNDVSNAVDYDVFMGPSAYSADAFGALDHLRHILHQLKDSPTLTEMFNDIRGAMHPSEFVQIDGSLIDHPVEIRDVAEVKTQLMNANGLPYIRYQGQLATPSNALQGSLTVAVDPVTGYLYQGNSISNPGIQFTFSSTYAGAFTGQSAMTTAAKAANRNLFNTYSNNVTPDDVIVSSRLRTVFQYNEKDSTDTNHLFVKYCGTEVAVNLTIGLVNATYGDADLVDTWFSSMRNLSLSIADIRVENIYHYYTNIDWLPLHYLYEVFTPMTTVLDTEYRYIYGDIGNYYVVSTDNLQQIHYAAVVSELMVPATAFRR